MIKTFWTSWAKIEKKTIYCTENSIFNKIRVDQYFPSWINFVLPHINSFYFDPGVSHKQWVFELSSCWVEFGRKFSQNSLFETRAHTHTWKWERNNEVAHAYSNKQPKFHSLARLSTIDPSTIVVVHAFTNLHLDHGRIRGKIRWRTSNHVG